MPDGRAVRQIGTEFLNQTEKERKMKILFTGALAVLFILGAIGLAMAEKGTMELKVGDEVYACNCGEKCPCNTMSRNPGNCTCGSPCGETTGTIAGLLA